MLSASPQNLAATLAHHQRSFLWRIVGRTGTAVHECVRPAGIFSATIYLRRLWTAAIAGFPGGFPNMLSSKKKLQLVAAFATLFLFALGVGCDGFFVDPTLTSVTVGPTATILQGATLQETAIGTYNDGSTKTLGSGVHWSSSDSSVASVNGSGLVTGNSASTTAVTITAALGASSGTAAVTVNLGITALKISPLSTTIQHNGGTATFQAFATIQGQSQPVDVSATATWSLSNETDYSISQGVTPATVTALSTSTAGQQIIVTATYQSGSQFTATATLTSQ
jgi:hypothetical protein